MIQWVAEAAKESGISDCVVVATPDQEILDVCKSAAIDAVRTRLDHPSGTDRIAEVAESVDADVYVNVQGDEPLVRPETICACAEPLLRDAEIQMGSVYAPCPDEQIENPAVVKVVTDDQSFAMYFSRCPIPFRRNPSSEPAKKHVGIYAYRKKTLLSFAKWQPTELEKTEGLEQLRFLEHRVGIYMALGQGSEQAVDTPEQAEQVRRLLKARRLAADIRLS